MTTLLDTSAVIAVLDNNDHHHTDAMNAWQNMINSDERIVMSGYAMIESFAVLHRRYGTVGVQMFVVMSSVIEVLWPDDALHNAAVNSMLRTPGRGGPSLVDCVSFEMVERDGIDSVFAYDKYFSGKGFNLIG